MKPSARQAERVLVAMSGGVDSAVVAALLQERGHDVVGVTLHLWDASGESQVGRCCAPEDRDDARRTCDQLGIPHYVFDERDAFLRSVVEPFVEAYHSGQTPSPCAQCNRLVKLERLVHLADRLGCGPIATGHYVRTVVGEGGHPRLLRGLDRDKDQSYFLYGLEPALLARLLTPLGEYSKDWTRQQGKRLGVPIWQKKDSQELCFIPDGNTEAFLRARGVAFVSGDFIDQDGAVVGRHRGAAAYTIGQRRGLGLGGGPPRYVLRVLSDQNRIEVGTEEALGRREACAHDARWIREAPRAPLRASVRIRHRHEPAAAWVTPTAGGFDVHFDEAQRAITPGQVAVVYDGDEVLGGGILT